jgi:hypothetical protein
MKVLKTIQSAEYKHFKNGSILNLINNFRNMYKKEREYGELLRTYEVKLKLFENNN